MEPNCKDYTWFFANDGCGLSIKTSVPLDGFRLYPNKVIILLHGLAGSAEYFCRNFYQLSGTEPGRGDGILNGNTGQAPKLWVIAPNLRGHADSWQEKGDYHVARLAMDLHNLITHIRHIFNSYKTNPRDELKIVAVGCSLGAAVLWTYAELFTCVDFAGLVFVDQAPFHNYAYFGEDDPDNWDDTKHHKRLYDATTLQASQEAWMSEDPTNIALALVNECLGYRQTNPLNNTPSEEEDEDYWHFCRIADRCDGKYDHRGLLEKIDVPVLVMAGGLSGCFPLEGTLETAKLIRSSGRKDMKDKVSVSIFENAGHWLFYEEPSLFNREILEFLDKWTN